jgi:hypothetical protein
MLALKESKGPGGGGVAVCVLRPGGGGWVGEKGGGGCWGVEVCEAFTPIPADPLSHHCCLTDVASLLLLLLLLL